MSNNNIIIKHLDDIDLIEKINADYKKKADYLATLFERNKNKIVMILSKYQYLRNMSINESNICDINFLNNSSEIFNKIDTTDTTNLLWLCRSNQDTKQKADEIATKINSNYIKKKITNLSIYIYIY